MSLPNRRLRFPTEIGEKGAEELKGPSSLVTPDADLDCQNVRAGGNFQSFMDEETEDREGTVSRRVCSKVKGERQ